MRRAALFVHGKRAGILEKGDDETYRIIYDEGYRGKPISIDLPIDNKIYEFKSFPPFFDGLLPEGFQLEALLKKNKIDRNDFFTQLVTVGADLVGAVTVEEVK